MTPKHTNHIKVPVTLPGSLSHTATLRLEIIKLSQTVGVISGYLVYKLGIIKETCCQTEAADIFIWPKYDSIPIPSLDLQRQIKLGMNSGVGGQIVMPVCFKSFSVSPWLKGSRTKLYI